MQSEIDGICELKIIDNFSIYVRRPKFSLLTLSKSNKPNLDQTIINTEETFIIADADHIFECYKLKEIREDSVVFEAELTFTGMGIPREEWTKKKIISVRPYVLNNQNITLKRISLFPG